MSKHTPTLHKAEKLKPDAVSTTDQRLDKLIEQNNRIIELLEAAHKSTHAAFIHEGEPLA